MPKLLTEDDVLVYPVNNKELATYLRGFTINELTPEIIFEVPEDAVIKVPKLKGFLLINKDCLYQESSTELLQITSLLHKIVESFRVDMVCKHVRKEGDITHTKTFSHFCYTISCLRLIKKFSGEAITLKEYMSSRYNYNPRVIANMRALLKILNDNA